MLRQASKPSSIAPLESLTHIDDWWSSRVMGRVSSVRKSIKRIVDSGARRSHHV